jgi:hypothetical protein
MTIGARYEDMAHYAIDRTIENQLAEVDEGDDYENIQGVTY